MRTTLLAASVALAALLPASHVAAQSSQDKAIAQQIGSQLKSSGQLHDYRIGVKYKDGVAQLTGTVANREQLHTALQLTQQLDGVERVVNNLSISGDTPNSLAKPASQQAARAGLVRNDAQPGRPQNGIERTSFQQSAGQQPMMRQGNSGNAGFNPNMGPMGPRPQRPMNQQPMNRMPQGRGNMPMPMGRGQIQQANAQQANAQQAMAQQAMAQRAMAQQAGCNCGPGGMGGGGMGGGGMGGGGMMGGPPMGAMSGGMGGAVNYDNAQMPGYAWPSYAASSNYAALSYPTQYSPTAWPYIGPFYPYPQVPLGWRKVALEWDDGWWFLDFSDCGANH